MDKKAVFNHYKYWLDRMLDNSLYFQIFFQEPYSLDANISTNTMDTEIFDDTIHLNFGISRGCLIDDDYPYVVKFDLYNAYHDGVYDMCNREQCFYSMAARENLERYFVRPVYIGDYVKEIYTYTFEDVGGICQEKYDERTAELELQEELDAKLAQGCPLQREDIQIIIPLFAYERADHFNPFDDSISEESEDIAESRTDSPLVNRNKLVGAAFIGEYGLDEFDRLSCFLSKNKINDLHCGNIGLVDSNYVIIDYAGFHDSDECC